MHSLSINETMLIIFPLLITQPHSKTKSICVTGSCLGQEKGANIAELRVFTLCFKFRRCLLLGAEKENVINLICKQSQPVW